MIEIRGIKVPICDHNRRLEQQIMKKLHLKTIPEYKILKQSIDARRKPNLFYIYHVGINVPNESEIIKNVNDNNVMLTSEVKYQFPLPGKEEINIIH